MCDSKILRGKLKISISHLLETYGVPFLVSLYDVSCRRITLKYDTPVKDGLVERTMVPPVVF